MEPKTSIGKVTGRGKLRITGSEEGENGEAEAKPIVVNSAMRSAVEFELRKIEGIETSIKDLREDIKDAIKNLTDRGLNAKAIKLALARRKMAADQELHSVDESLSIICGIGSLGIQGELFDFESDLESGNGNEAA